MARIAHLGPSDGVHAVLGGALLALQLAKLVRVRGHGAGLARLGDSLEELAGNAAHAVLLDHDLNNFTIC